MSYQPQLFGEGRFERWLKFHSQNPHVYELFLGFTREARQAGRACFGSRVIWERMRWYLEIETASEDGTKLNNDFVPYYSRLAMLRNPDLAGFFERRDARFDVDDATLLRRAAEVELQEV